MTKNSGEWGSRQFWKNLNRNRYSWLFCILHKKMSNELSRGQTFRCWSSRDSSISIYSVLVAQSISVGITAISVTAHITYIVNTAPALACSSTLITEQALHTIRGCNTVCKDLTRIFTLVSAPGIFCSSLPDGGKQPCPAGYVGGSGRLCVM